VFLRVENILAYFGKALYVFVIKFTVLAFETSLDNIALVRP
jgi:hypothetical protein